MGEAPSRPSPRESGHWGTKVRFLVAGAWNTLFGYGVFWLLDDVFSIRLTNRRLAYLSAMVLSNVLAILNAFIFHKYFTFRSVERGQGVVKEFIRFTATYVGTFALSLVLLPALVEFGGIAPKPAGAVVLLACVGISYFGHSRFSFPNRG